MPSSSRTSPEPPRDVISALAFVEEQTAALEQAIDERWYANAIEAIESERNEVADHLRACGYAREVDEAIARGERGLVSNKGKKGKGRRRSGGKKTRKPTFELTWERHDEIPSMQIEAASVLGDDVKVLVARITKPRVTPWRLGYWSDAKGIVFSDDEFDNLTQAKLAAEAEARAAVRLASELRVLRPRAANREVGDVVLAARQYQRAVEDRMAAMDRGTPEELSKATKREKETKEALEDMTGANRELLGAIAGATIGAALGGLLNPVAAAIAALAAGAVGSVVARPSLSEAPTPEPRGDRDHGENVVPFYPRRPRGPRAANKDRR